MAKRKMKGGSIFSDDMGNWTGLSKFLFFIAVLAVAAGIAYGIYLLVTNLQPSSGSPNTPSPNKLGPGGTQRPNIGPGGTPFVGPTGPPISTLPGRINVATVAQSPSAGQAVIYFSEAEAGGTTCQTCSATFSVNMVYSGGRPNPESVTRTVTAPSTSGTVTIDYSAPSTGSPGTPMPPEPAYPTQVKLTVLAYSTNPQTGEVGAKTTFTKTIPYV